MRAWSTPRAQDLHQLPIAYLTANLAQGKNKTRKERGKLEGKQKNNPKKQCTDT